MKDRTTWIRAITWKRRVLGFLLTVIVVGIPAWITIHLMRREGPHSTLEKPPEFDRLRLSGISSEVLEEDRRVVRISVEDLVHRKRKLGPLTINPVKEIIVSGLRLEIESPGSESEGLGEGGFGEGGFMDALHDGLLEMLEDNDLGFISRILIDDLDIVVTWEGLGSFTFHAGHAELGDAEQTMKLERGISIEGSSGDRLDAWRGRWEPSEKRLVVTASFVFQREGEVERGSHATFRFGRAGEIHRE